MVESISSLTGGRITDPKSYDATHLEQTGRRMFTNSKGETFLLTKHQRWKGPHENAYLNLYKQETDAFGIPEWKKVGTKVEEYGYLGQADGNYKQSKFATTIERLDSEGKSLSKIEHSRPRVMQMGKAAYYQPVTTIELGEKGLGGAIKMTKIPKTFEITKPISLEIANPKNFSAMMKRVLKLISKAV